MSSGKMGYSIAQAASEMGAKVTLISGPVALNPPPGAKIIGVVSAQDMLNAVTKNIAKQDIFISVAAVADYRPSKTSSHKIKKADKKLILELSPNVDILAKVAAMRNAPFCVGFAAESENLLKLGEQKRLAKKLPLIVANLVQETLGRDNAALTLLDNKGKHVLPKASKIESARLLLQHIATMLKTSKTKAKP
jgi:phosphopantothenoylcysteine decarboxylase/phosphopantothenate--cysteine ligase